MSKRPVPGYDNPESGSGILEKLKARLRIGDRLPDPRLIREEDGGLPGQARATKGHEAPRVPRPVSAQESGWDTPVDDSVTFIPPDPLHPQIPRMNRYPGGADQFRSDLGTALGRNNESLFRQRGVRRRGSR